MRNQRYLYCLLACALGCGDNSDDAVSCDFAACVELEARPSPVQRDGSVTVQGSVRFRSDPKQAACTGIERAVHAVYVADQEVLPVAGEFNFRTWSIQLAAERLAPFVTTTRADGSKQVSLPVRARLYGGCAVELPEAEQPVIELPAPGLSGSWRAPP
jgi:hypothetical protein